MEIHIMFIGCERERCDLVIMAPRSLAGYGVIRLDVALLFVPGKIPTHSRLIAGVMKRQKRIKLPFLRAFQNKNLPPIHDDFLRALTAGQFVNEFARGGIEHAHRFIDAERDVNSVLHCHEPPCQLRRAALQRPQMAVPFFHRLFPKDHAVERVTRHQRPARRQLDGHPRAFVHHINHTAIGRHQCAHARHTIVVARPTRTTEPL